ncbi:MAG: alkyl hydroperoxide reductase [Alphaproteobacteria bacterium CG_4_10_14_0_8_um_filter_37_21]|nr:MAG: alkyl hydroperoxide reductase [Alphaproteobacteria bacterium CG_4_10_14_0_8_um_filter_37_21]
MTNLVTQKAPNFTAPAVMGDNTINEEFNLMEYLNGDMGVLFFYPLDFTFVCPSEILAFQNRMAEFKERNVKVVAVSVDSAFSHIAWKNTPVNNGGLGNVQFPMVADLTKQISKDYHVLINDAVALRGTFLIDQDGIVQHQVINNLPLGRNVDEALRMVDALAFHQKNGEVCPAGWSKGKKGMVANAQGVASFLKDNAASL